MSLPNPIRDTTEHPSKNAVSAPVDRQEKVDDVDRKVLLLYSIPLLPLTGAMRSLSALLLRHHRSFPPGALSF